MNMKIRATPRKKSSRRSRGGRSTAEPSIPESGGDAARRRGYQELCRPSIVRGVVCRVIFYWQSVTDRIRSDTFSDAAGKNLRPDLFERAGYAGSLPSGEVWADGERCLGLVLNLGEGQAGRQLCQGRSSVRDRKDAEIGDHHVDH